MQENFKEYHRYTTEEFKELWDNCLFVFDTNTLLNVYRYSRPTVNTFFKVLTGLKRKSQLWIPYQVGYEFYENRINVISDYEKSYDVILNILAETKKNIENIKYKDHPFLDLTEVKSEVEKCLSGVESKIKSKKTQHPKWLEQDDVLDKLNILFEGNVGDRYSKKRIDEIAEEGKQRYEKNIPPGFKDIQKSEEKRYGDLILWFQMIDKAKEAKKPIILISGDIKEDWWLEKDGKRLCPLPLLKREMLDKAGVDFHIYTADSFLQYYLEGNDQSAIKEVKKIRELEEQGMGMKMRLANMQREREHGRRVPEDRFLSELMHASEALQDILMMLQNLEIDSRYKEEFDLLLKKVLVLRNRNFYIGFDEDSARVIYKCIKEILFLIDRMIISTNDYRPHITLQLKESSEKLDRIAHRLNRFI